MGGDDNSFEIVALPPPGCRDPGIPVAANRAGFLGVLDLTYVRGVTETETLVERLAKLAPERLGVHIDTLDSAVVEQVVSSLRDIDWILVAPGAPDLAHVLERARKAARRVGLSVTSSEQALEAESMGFDFVAAKGSEAGGRVGEETAFVLLQRVLATSSLPVLAWGGIGRRTAAACRAAGAAGVILDWQLALSRESPFSSAEKTLLAEMDGSATTLVRGPADARFRLYAPAGASGLDELTAIVDRGGTSEEWEEKAAALTHPHRRGERMWPMGQDIALASQVAPLGTSVSQALRTLADHVERSLRASVRSAAIAADSALARSHRTKFPIVQGPMTRVSDVPAFADAVEAGGGLPFLALALMKQDDVRRLLTETRELMGDRSWGIGILGFVDRATREQQLEVIEEIRPPFAIIAGGRPDQAKRLSDLGVMSYLHAPSPTLLRSFLADGGRRFVFEGRECGGHVGPLSSFVLWESMIEVLLDADLTDEDAAGVHVLFAGGIHDARSGSMVAAMAEPLVERGMKIGMVLGTAYLFTEEVVSSGALAEEFQNVALRTRSTAVLQTGPGHAIRCAPTPYTARFQSESERLRRVGEPVKETTELLARMHLGRLRLASKGLKRVEPSGSTGSGDNVVPASSEEQRREGMYMLGQVASLHEGRNTILALHEDVCREGMRRLERFVDLPVVEAPRTPPPAPFDIAIVGMSCLLPGANDIASFWQNIINKVDAIEEIPVDRFDIARWFDADRSKRDRTDSKWGGFLSDIPFDPLKFGIPPKAIDSIEPAQLLALVLVESALRDAGYLENNSVKLRTSVILGAGGGMAELGANYTMRAMLPGLIENVDDSLYGQLPEWTEDSFAGILLNVIAGRVSNRFDLGGVNFTVDAACASSLASVYLACRELTEGSSDMVIAGGCDTNQNPLSYMCFAKAGALSPTGRSRAFDVGADGLAIGEGLAAVVLKRREDAERDGDRIYALIRAVAGGSDGRQRSLTAPAIEGQQRTLRRAYEQAAFPISTLGLVEAHGTGTALGDPIECRAIAGLLEREGARKASVAIGSVKSMIGHTKATAGIAGLVKATLALHHRVLPPTLHVQKPNPKAELETGPLHVSSETRPWIRGAVPRRAGVSAFGFGGTNFHAVLEEYEADASPHQRDSPRRHRASELFLFEGASNEALERKLRAFTESLRPHQDDRSGASLADIARRWHLSRGRGRGAHRAALVASSVDELQGQCSWLVSGQDPSVEPPAGAYRTATSSSDDPSVAFLFPGQGSQFVNMLVDLAVEFTEVRECFERADALLSSALDQPLSELILPRPSFDEASRRQAATALKQTEIAQPALGVCDVAMLQLLASFGVRPDMVGGHSYGELVALHAAGAYDEDALYRLSYERGQAMVTGATSGAELGGMLALSMSEAETRQHLEGLDEVWLANINSPRQTILSGTQKGLDAVSRRLDDAGLSYASVPVACGFHSPLVSHARERFSRALERAEIREPELAVYNNATAAVYDAQPERIRALLADNLVRHVRFADEIEAMHASGARIFVEVGPGNVLTKLVGQILDAKPHVAVATHPRGADGLTSLHHCLAVLYSHGVMVEDARLYRGRDWSSGDTDVAPECGIWVNGAYARAMTQPPRTLAPRARIETEVTEASPPRSRQDSEEAFAPAAPEPPPRRSDSENGRSTAFSEFQRTMRRFLETQQTVLEAYTQQRSELPADVATTEASRVTTRSEPAPRVEAPPPPDAAAPTPESPKSQRNPTDRLLAIVSERTGYPVDVLDLDADLEADLGIDSIKRVEIIATYRREIAPHLDAPPEWFAEEMSDAMTLSAITAGVQKLVGTNGDRGEPAPLVSTVTPPAASAQPSKEESPRCVPVIVDAPPDAYEGGAHDLSGRFFLLTDDDQGVARAVGLAIEAAGGRARLIDGDELFARDDVFRLVDDARRSGDTIAGLVHLTPLSDAPAFPEIEDEEWMRHLNRDVRGLLFLLQALAPELERGSSEPFRVLAMSRGGGDFRGSGEECTHPWRGGLAGLVKTAAMEWPDACFRSLDVDADPEATAILKELDLTGPVEVGYRDGRRLAIELARREIPRGAPTSSVLSSDSVIVVTGGARGITAEIAIDLASKVAARFVLLGRSPHPEEADDQDQEEPSDIRDLTDPKELRAALVTRIREHGDRPAPATVEKQLRELLAARDIRATLAQIRDRGAEVEYRSDDVADPRHFAEALRAIQRRYGRIDALIHGAGVIEDKRIADKSAESFDRVVATKVAPMLALAKTLEPGTLELLVLFSSVAGFLGNRGQGDYAAANEILNRLARRIDDLWPTRAVAMNWGPWAGIGMVSAEVAAQFRERNVGMVSVDAGRRAVWDEIEFTGRGDVRVIVGPGPWVPSTGTSSASSPQEQQSEIVVTTE